MEKKEIIKISSKSRLVLILLIVFLGMLGVHRMYAGKWITGIIMLLGFISFYLILFVGLWLIYDLIIAITGEFTDKEGGFIRNW